MTKPPITNRALQTIIPLVCRKASIIEHRVRIKLIAIKLISNDLCDQLINHYVTASTLMCMSVFVCECVCIWVYMGLFFVFAFICMYVCVFVNVCSCIWVYFLSVYLYIYVCAFNCLFVCLCMCSCIRLFVCICVCESVNTHKHIYAFRVVSEILTA